MMASLLTANVLAAAVWVLLPLLAFGFARETVTRAVNYLPVGVRLLFPVFFSVPYLLIAAPAGTLQADWLVCYLIVPIIIAVLLWHARHADPQQLGNWRDFAIILVLGLAVDLRWLDPAWPPRLQVFGKMILLDGGLYGFLAIRQLTNVGFDLRPRWRDLRTGFRELAFYAPIALLLGLTLGFLHWHPQIPRLLTATSSFAFTFLLIALPEEIFFRGWLQNLLERRAGKIPALLITALIFGLAHFNKRAPSFNWRYVLLAAIAGIFYGRAWRQDRRIFASSITHACVDTIWGLWLL
ncbi:MAG TPA: CPBP family intramembrane glutamic endopeptidase [Terriglobales bacterium]